ncbi:AGAP001292-PA-like protein [Anopheles sinensis]|uniref:AGAP001292-PA-like protein n=1 Tax=Anopheles sinensis TaxID=74873 RepID=A0A084VXT4_ANOSI|nr:AGAP001292-PA-like protein [Anopheles sinensis]
MCPYRPPPLQILTRERLFEKLPPLATSPQWLVHPHCAIHGDKFQRKHHKTVVKPPKMGVISISSTSSAQSAVTDSSCPSSSASGRYSLLNSVVQQVGRGAEMVKQKVQGTILNRLTTGKVQQQHHKSLSMFDLNKSEHCIKPTALHKIEHRGVKEEEANDDGIMDDTDSLKSEQNHFIPIIASLPKSSFSLDTVTRAVPVRPVVFGSKYGYSPKKSPYRPLKPTSVHHSAFSVVKLFTPPKISPLESEKAGAKCKRTPTKTPPRRGRPRGTKVKFTPTRARKPAPRSLERAARSGSGGTSTRTTRSSVEAQANAIRELIISDQQRREQQIEMEKRDFEFAQRLQEKLNRTSGIMQEIHRQYPAPRSTGYSLRRKGPANCTPNDESLNGTSSSTEECSSKNTPAKKSRKRKATSSSVENDVPSSSSPAKQTADRATPPRQTRPNRTSKRNNVTLPADTSVAIATGQQSIPQRKSTRNKTR